MNATDSRKRVQLYFYSMSIERKKRSADDTPYDISAIFTAFSQLLTSVVDKELLNRKLDIESKDKTIWLDSFIDLGDGNYNLLFKSAKSNQSRFVRDTITMEGRGVLKKPEDGDEELTHILIRYRKDSERFLAACEFNYYGIGTGDIKRYLNNQFDLLQSETDGVYSYAISFEILPSADFLTELNKMTKINVLRLTVDIADFAQGDFHRFSGKNEFRTTVDISLHKSKGKKNNISQDIIKEVYADTGGTKKIRKIAVEGANQSGNLKIDTESIQMRHSIMVETLGKGGDVVTNDFFAKAGDFIKEMRV